MKRIPAALTALTLTLCTLPLHTAAEDTEETKIGAFTYKLYDDHAEVTGFSAPQLRAVTIPSEANGLPVTRIGDLAFNGVIWVPEFIIPDTVTEIGADAFGNCDWLETVTVPGSVKTIGSGAFASCDKLTSVTLEEGVESIGKHAFYKCPELAEISIPDSLYSIAPDTAYPDSNPFAGTAWYDAQPDGLLYAGHVLLGYKGGRPEEETSLVIPEGTTGIRGGAFYGMKNLVSVTLPESLRSIGASAFYQCSLSDISIPAQVEHIGKNAFWACPAEHFTLAAGNPCLSEQSGILYNIDKTEIVAVPYLLQSAELPETLTGIPDYAFSGRDHLTEIGIPASVTQIGHYAFCNCRSLRAVQFSDGLQTIGNHAFAYCTALEYVLLPDSVTDVGLLAFSDCTALSLVQLSAGLTSLPVEQTETIYEPMWDFETGEMIEPGYSTFENYGVFRGCTNLQTLLLPKEVASLPAGTFSGAYIRDVWYTGTKTDFASADYLSVPVSRDGVPDLTLPNHFGTIHYSVLPDSDVQGDADMDGRLTVTDAVLLQRYLLGDRAMLPQGITLSDLNGDGATDIYDLALMKHTLIR